METLKTKTMKSELIKSDPQNLLKLAIEKGAGLEQLEKLMDLQERWEKNEARKAFFKSMAEFQKVKPSVKKDKKADYGQGKAKYNWASFDSIQKAIDPVLSDLGLSYTFETIEEGKLTIICKVTHELGHSEQTQLSAPNDNTGGKNPIQALGSTNSYLRRYTLSNAFGISADEDNDGNTVEKEPLEKITKKEIEDLKDKLIEVTSKEDLTELWKSNSKYKLSKEATKLFTEKGVELQ